MGDGCGCCLHDWSREEGRCTVGVDHCDVEEGCNWIEKSVAGECGNGGNDGEGGNGGES